MANVAKSVQVRLWPRGNLECLRKRSQSVSDIVKSMSIFFFFALVWALDLELAFGLYGHKW
jgi:hypothetical protein